MTEILTTLTTYIVTDEVYPHEVRAESPRAAAETLLDGYDWGEGTSFNGEVRDTNDRTLATFRATPEGITSFTELPR